MSHALIKTVLVRRAAMAVIAEIEKERERMQAETEPTFLGLVIAEIEKERERMRAETEPTFLGLGRTPKYSPSTVAFYRGRAEIRCRNLIALCNVVDKAGASGLIRVSADDAEVIHRHL